MLDNAVAILQQLIAQGMPNAQAMQLLQYYVYSCCHGANVAALASAQVNNGAGMSGIAPKCKVMPVGVFSDRVLLTQLYVEGALRFSSLVAGLCTGAGVGLAVLWRANPSWKQNLFITGLTWAAGAFVGVAMQVVVAVFA